MQKPRISGYDWGLGDHNLTSCVFEKDCLVRPQGILMILFSFWLGLLFVKIFRNGGEYTLFLHVFFNLVGLVSDTTFPNKLLARKCNLLLVHSTKTDFLSYKIAICVWSVSVALSSLRNCFSLTPPLILFSQFPRKRLFLFCFYWKSAYTHYPGDPPAFPLAFTSCLEFARSFVNIWRSAAYSFATSVYISLG